MRCPKCEHDNREGVKFCEECGARMPSLCPGCGSEISAGAKFCGECGTRLTEGTPGAAKPEGPKLEDMHTQLQSLIPEELAQKYMTAEQQATGENRPITALFADISGFTPLSNTQSSETMFQLVQDCFKELVGIVARYEGSISGFRGDGLLALFGAPILHENDAERAILAALDMRAAIQEQELQVSIGINTAMVTVGEIQTQLHKEYTAYGADVNLAKRLQEAADPGQVLVGTGTHRLTRRIFDFEILPELSVKGYQEPITAYIVQQVKGRPEKLRGIEGLRARMIGREREFDDLKMAVDELIAGKGSIVSVIGEAGIGKSRMVTELRDYLASIDDAEQSISILEGRCVSIGQPISYWPFIDILRTYFGISEEDDTYDIVQKITESIDGLMPQEAEETLPLMRNLLSIIEFGKELDDRLRFATPEQIRHQTLIRLRDIFRTLADKRPLLLVLEDLHWSDDLSLDLISLLMDELVSTPLTLLCVYRPEKDHRIWQLGDQARRKCLDRYTEITLHPLSSHQSLLLVESLFEIENLPESTKDKILHKSEGNPFFIEEVIRSLIEQDMIYQEDNHWKARDEIASISVPDTIQSVVLARVDRLQAEAKYVLQCASVIGRLFKYRLLEHLARQERDLDGYIAEFEGKELIYEERTVPELEYAFKHAFTQEATYEGILEQRRRRFHHQVAENIERLYQERIEEYSEELAYHYSRSGNADKAVEYLLKAAYKAQLAFANNNAIQYFRQALGIWGDLPDTEENKRKRLNALMRLSEIYFTIGHTNEAIEEAEKALKLAQAFASSREIAHLHYQISDAFVTQNQFKAAIEWGKRGLGVLGDDQVCPEAAVLNFCIGTSYMWLGDSEEKQKYLIRNRDIIRQIGYFDEIYKIYVGLGLVSETLEERVTWQREWIEVCSQHENQLGLAEGHIYLAFSLEHSGALPEAIEHCGKGLAIAKKIGYSLFVLIGHSNLGKTLLKAEERIEAEKHLREAVNIMEDWGRQFEPWETVRAYILLAEILIERGDQEEAYQYLIKGLRLATWRHLEDFLIRLKDICEATGKLGDFADLCRSELELRDRDDDLTILNNFLSDAQRER